MRTLQMATTALFTIGTVAALAGCGASSPAPLYGDTGDHMVFAITSGQGNRTVELATSQPPDHPRYIGIAVNCVGPGSVMVRLHPGGEGENVACGSAGGGTDLAGPLVGAAPMSAAVTAEPGTRWNLAVTDPAGSLGVASGK